MKEIPFKSVQLTDENAPRRIKDVHVLVVLVTSAGVVCWPMVNCASFKVVVTTVIVVRPVIVVVIVIVVVVVVVVVIVVIVVVVIVVIVVVVVVVVKSSLAIWIECGVDYFRSIRIKPDGVRSTVMTTPRDISDHTTVETSTSPVHQTSRPFCAQNPVVDVGFYQELTPKIFPQVEIESSEMGLTERGCGGYRDVCTVCWPVWTRSDGV